MMHIELVDPADHFLDSAEAQLRHDLAQFLRNEEHVIDHMFRLAGKARAQHGVLRRNAHGAGIQMALAHHNTARRD